MRLIGIWLAATVLGVFATSVQACGDDASKSVEQLLLKVTELEAHLVEVEARMAHLLAAAHRSPSPSTPPSTIPEDAIPREFNGQTYYIIPLGESEPLGPDIDR